jgi:BolA family transcriptional regulator, general stress-responsive regulator
LTKRFSIGGLPRTALKGESMTVKDWISTALRERLDPISLSVADESHQHVGHAGWREGGETHFSVDIVSAAFTGKSRVDRHRIVNDAVREAFQRGLHALAINARAPGEP